MFCCFQRPQTDESIPHINDNETKPLRSSKPTTINYKTLLTIPYAHVIEDDKIPIESSNINELSTSGTYIVFNSAIYDEKYDPGCFSFDDVKVPPPVMIATKTTDGQILLERVFQIEHVRAVNPIKTVNPARPYDEFVDTSNNPSDTSCTDNKTD